MKKKLQEVIEIQIDVREFFKKSKNLSQTLDRQTAILVVNVLKQIENMKQKYPELIIDETDKDIISNLKEFYSLLEGKAILSFIRMPKIIMILDDMSSCSLFCQVQENEFYKMIIQQRHLNIFAVFIAAHEMSTLYSAFKTQLTGFLLFQGINYEKMKDYFSQVQELQSDYFSMTDFMNLYKYKICAAHEKNDVEKQKYVHKFLYVVICPTSKVYEGFSILINILINISRHVIELVLDIIWRWLLYNYDTCRQIRPRPKIELNLSFNLLFIFHYYQSSVERV
ncbi:Conserved_hypothetical protein [Hexamita inflata]|uniref:Uncharacterized protein n=1 Tax=Hexamita inflata TaxID=28002 RepID=A0AA86UIL0_9EUKA|nr:Conserved hypothetical protein [Hexamita inflata]